MVCLKDSFATKFGLFIVTYSFFAYRSDILRVTERSCFSMHFFAEMFTNLLTNAASVALVSGNLCCSCFNNSVQSQSC